MERCIRYLIVLYYQPNKLLKKADVNKQKQELEIVKDKFNISSS